VEEMIVDGCPQKQELPSSHDEGWSVVIGEPVYSPTGWHMKRLRQWLTTVL